MDEECADVDFGEDPSIRKDHALLMEFMEIAQTIYGDAEVSDDTIALTAIALLMAKVAETMQEVAEMMRGDSK